MSDLRLGRRLMDRLAAFAQYSDEPEQLTRLYLTSAHRAAVDQLLAWMTDAGLSASVDALATVIGRYEGAKPDAPTLLIGSHIDTIRDAGRYDGTLGVLAGLTVVEELASRNERLPFAIEILAFGDEEGIRFPSTLLGSRAIAGSFEPAWMDMQDAAGISLREALADFGCDPSRADEASKAKQKIVGYVEAHIEQGPVLEAENCAVGVVSAINGVKRLTIEVKGHADHAGTVPMHMRRDALTAASEMILAVEAAAAATSDVVATVGRADVAFGAVNVIPGLVSFTIDIRAPSDAERNRALDDIMRRMHEIAARRSVDFNDSLMHQAPATACSPFITDGLRDAIARQGLPARILASGAGHDAMAIAALCPVGMLFVRCAGGISHNPAESITTEDADVCVHVLLDFIRNLRPE